jgi:hypothetical protein
MDQFGTYFPSWPIKSLAKEPNRADRILAPALITSAINTNAVIAVSRLPFASRCELPLHTAVASRWKLPLKAVVLYEPLQAAS